jgi:NitT/TauT family transport system ATP-binding protein
VLARTSAPRRTAFDQPMTAVSEAASNRGQEMISPDELPAIRFRNVSLTFGEERVLDDIGFDVPRGSFVCLLGPSGCGKSTTLRIIGGLIKASQGEVSVFGRAPVESWQRLAYVFQAPRLVAWRTALENVILGMDLRLPHLSSVDKLERARKYLGMVSLARDADKFPDMLSGGERQRVALARALAVDPDIILMDEPFAALDFTTRRNLRDTLIQIWRETGKTVLFVTHDVDEALYLADQVVIFSGKPTTIKKIVDLHVPRPRNIETDPTLTKMADEVRQVFLDMEGGSPPISGPTEDPPAVRPERTRKSRRSEIVQRVVADGAVLLAFIAWYVYSKYVPEFVMPDPIKSLKLAVELFYRSDLVYHTFISFVRVVSAVVLSLLIGGVVVWAGWYFWPLRLLVANRIIPFLNAFSSLGWAMLAIIWFGVNDRSVLFVEVMILLPFSMINLWEGVRSLDNEILEMARSFTQGRLKILWRVVLPLLFPFIIAAVRMSYGVGWKVGLIAELFGSRAGLGYLLDLARQNLDTPLVFAVIIALVAMVMAMERLVFDPLERRAQRQYARQEQRAL